MGEGMQEREMEPRGGERGREPVSAPHVLSPTSPLPLSPVSLL